MILKKIQSFAETSCRLCQQTPVRTARSFARAHGGPGFARYGAELFNFRRWEELEDGGFGKATK
jgi:hypothetical protein